MSKWVVSGLLAVIVCVGLIFSVVTTRSDSEVSAQQTDVGSQQQTEIQEQLSAIQDELALVRGQLREVQDELGLVRNQLTRFTRVLWPAKSEPAAYTKAFVEQAIRRYETEGRDATLAFYNSMESVDGEWYVFIADENDLMVAHPVQEIRGQKVQGPLGTDISGYDFGAEIVTATAEGKWVDYVYLNPADNQQETKHAWVVRHDGLLFGSGWYEPLVAKADPATYTKAFVELAISRYEAMGRDDAIEFYNSMASVDGPWYIFIADENDIILAHPTVPENIGEDLKGPLGTDISGYDFGAEIATATAEGKWVDYVYLNPAHDNQQETKHTWVIRHDGLIFGSGWYEPLVAKADPAAYTKAFVDQAISRYDTEGRDDTIAFYNSMDSVDGPWYVFIIDENDILIAHPILPENIGQDTTGQTDSTGYNFGAEIATATAEGKWVDYIYLNPANDNQQETKHTWVIRHDGLIFGSGWYDPTVSKADPAAYTKAFVDQAISRYDTEGRDDTIAFYNSMDSVDGPWYVFIIDEDDILIAHPILPENIGQDTTGQTDSTGYNFGAEIATATAEGKWVDYVYLNPAHDNQQETKHAWVIRHDGLIFGSGWYEPMVAKADPAAYTKAFVDQAISRYDTEGRDDTIAFYNSMESIDGQWYVFIIDEDDILIAHPAIPEYAAEHTDGYNLGAEITDFESASFLEHPWVKLAERRDINGYNFGAEMATATAEGKWVDYVYHIPAQDNQQEIKHAWVVRHDGLLFGSGWYEPMVTKADPVAYTKAFVNQAISRYDTEGRDDTIAFYNSMESVDGPWYIFIADENDIILAHPTVPENIGEDLKGPLGTDISGYDFGAEIATATAEGKWVDYVYLNPAHDNQQETKHTWVIRHDGLIFGSGWYEQKTVMTQPSVDVLRLPRLYNKAGWYKPLATKSDPAAYTKAFVNQAISRYDAMGRDAALEFYNSMDSVDGEWYIFIADENDITIVHPTIPEHIGDDIKIRTDSTGYNFGTDIAAANEEGKWVDYTHQNPATDQYEIKHSWVIRHDGLIFGSGWYEK